MDNLSLGFFAWSEDNAGPVSLATHVHLYNMSNRPILIDRFEYYLLKTKVESGNRLIDVVPDDCPSTGELAGADEAYLKAHRIQFFPAREFVYQPSTADRPSAISNYGLRDLYRNKKTVGYFLDFDGLIIQPGSIADKTFVAQPYGDSYLGPFYMEGLLCALIAGTDWEGRDIAAVQEVALVKVDAPAQDPDLAEVRTNRIVNVTTLSREPNQQLHYVNSD
jgi:hypothetical protein